MSFASFPLDTILPSQAGAFARDGLITAADVLLPSDPKKVRNKDTVLDVARAICPQSWTVAELLRDRSGSASQNRRPPSPRYVSTGDEAFDSLLGGGVRVGAITELAGESAAGKSTMTLSLAIGAGIAGDGTIVLTSERVLATSRLVELATSQGSTQPIHDILDNIHTSRVSDIDTLEHALAFVVPPMLKTRGADYSPLMGEINPPPIPPASRGHRPIRLLILDSLTALLRGETASSGAGLTQRSRHLCTIADKLKALAVEYDLAVVVVNQVSDVFTSAPVAVGVLGVPQVSTTSEQAPPMVYSTQARHFSGQSPGVNKEAALGIVWANAVNTRVMLARTGRRRVLESDLEDKVLIRRAHLVFSPFATPATLDFVIDSTGIHGLPGSWRAVDLGPAIRRRDMRLRAERGVDDTVVLAEVDVDVDAEADEMEVPPEFFLTAEDEFDVEVQVEEGEGARNQ